MKLSVSFHGAVARTTGSAHLLQANHKRFLLDCGMIQGLPFHYNRKFTFDPESIDAVILSHAHIDHCGRIPLLYDQGFEGPVYCTGATRDLAEILMLDSVHVSLEEAKKEQQERGRKGYLEPLYTTEDVYQTLEHFKTIPYNKPVEIEDKITVKLIDAGHILGSAQIILDFDGTIVAFTGDLGQNGAPLIKDPAPIEQAHYLFTESTYGNRRHPPMKKSAKRLMNYAKHVAEKGGKMLIPSFAVGRTQRLIYYFNELFEKGEIDKTPVYLDSPMAIDATEIFLRHPECYDQETLQLLKSGDNPLQFPELKFSKSEHDSRAILRGWETCIVFAGSGMCTGGRILSHLINELPMKKSRVILVGFQAKGTLGRELVDGVKKVEIYDKQIPVKAQIDMIRGFSAHADREELKQHISRMEQKPLKTFVVHGEAEQSLTFAANLRNTLKIWARVPEYREVYYLRNS
ncbi:MAG: MBL fold metallo-hydrolase [Candidatus Heimdallarchaeota archaeon]|nr:MBL fold metallo-hydrolase [Candidatus Heimdallarchaeota archaeon]